MAELLAGQALLVSQHDLGERDFLEFSDLLAAKSSESDVEHFFRQRPVALSLAAALFGTGHHMTWIFPKQRIRLAGPERRGLIPDYLIAGANSDGLTWFALELKGPDKNAFSTKGPHTCLSSEANRGIGQLIAYLDGASRDQSYLRDGLSLTGFREPEGVLLIGTDEETRDPRKREFRAAWNRINPRVRIRSYSALRRQMAEKLKVGL